MQTYALVPAVASHISHLAAKLREIDKREIWASHRHSPREALVRSLRASHLAWSCMVEGKPVFMWGVAQAPSTIMYRCGRPWLLGTSAIEGLTIPFMRQSRVAVAALHQHYDHLSNHVHAENNVSIRWLGWLGFTIEKAKPVQWHGETFYKFWRDFGCINKCP